jgi:hypothetical protein
MTESEYLDYLNEKNLINANRKKQLEQVKKQLKFRPLETPILVNIEDINIPDRFKQNPVSDHKIDRVLYYYNTYLQFDKPVTLLSSDNNLLTDGYSRFVVAEMLDIGWIPVIYER